MSIEIIAALMLGIACATIVVKWPPSFWYLLVVANIFGNGPRLFGYFFWDEWLTGSLVLGALTAIALAKGGFDAAQGEKEHKIVFLLWAFYMVMESFIGMLVNEDVRIVRWILFYCLLIALFLVLQYRSGLFPFPPFRRLAPVILIATTLYYISYLAHGIFIEQVLGMGGLGRHAAQFLTDGLLWSGSATAVFPTLIAMPVAMALISNRSILMRLLAAASVFMMMLIAFYYDSRISWVVIFGAFILSAARIRLSSLAAFLASFALVFALYVPNPTKNVSEFFYTIFEGTQALWAPGESDVTRKLQMHAGFLRLTDNPRTFFFGDGMYSHRFTIAPYMNELYLKYLPEQKFEVPGHKEARDDSPGAIILFRTTAFTALLIDAGLIGMLLFTLNFMYIGIKPLFKRGLEKRYFLFIPVISYMWMANNNISEVILLYLLIMPMGLLEQLAGDEFFLRPAARAS